MTMIYIICKYITYPGAYLRAFWEQLTCRILKLPVEPQKYLRLDEASGHVEHSLAKKEFSAFLIAMGPGFMNFNIGLPIFLAGYLNLAYLGITPYDSIGLFLIYAVLTYLGISLMCSLFPLQEDILNFWSMAYGKQSKASPRIILRILVFIPALITRIGAFLEKYCIPELFWILFLIYKFVIAI